MGWLRVFSLAVRLRHLLFASSLSGQSPLTVPEICLMDVPFSIIFLIFNVALFVSAWVQSTEQ